ncbi:MAG: nucleotidyltransferase family protein [Pseudomonadota bacterium]
MQIWQRAVAPPGSSLRDIISVIDKAGLQTALICEEHDKLVGLVTDGDVRRALLQGAVMTDSADNIVNRRPMVISANETRQRAVMLMRQFGLAQIPVLDDAGRVVGLETLLSHGNDEVDAPTAVIMAGGLGTRLAPLTNTLPKPMLKVGDKPILETIIERLALHRLNRIVVCVNYKAEIIQDHFGDGSQWNVNISYVHEKERRGTAGALSLLPDLPTGPTVVMNGDVLTAVDFEALLDFHKTDPGSATMCVREHVVEVEYGVAEIEGTRLTALSEKPQLKYFINAGVYVLDPQALTAIPSVGYYDMTTLFDELIEDGQAPAVFPIREKWLDVGQFHDLARAQDEISGFFER